MPRGKLEHVVKERANSFDPEAIAEAPAFESDCTPAPALFSRALCVCNDFAAAGRLTTIAKAGEAANVGIEHETAFAMEVNVAGSLWSSEPLSFAGGAEIRDHLWTGDDLSFAGRLHMGGELACGGDLAGAGSLSASMLRVEGDFAFAGSVEGAEGDYVEPAVAPCGCDAPYDVVGAVDAAEKTNDNASVGLTGDYLSVGESELVLPSGKYFVTSATAVGKLSVRAEGAVQLYVRGDLIEVGETTFSLADGATLDVFVDGTVAHVGNVSYGDEARPDAFRLYVGGTDSMLVSAGTQDFHGMLYAPQADVAFAGNTTVHGAVFANNLSYAGQLTIEYSEPVPTDDCLPPPDDSDPPVLPE